jgi:histidine triad (HIT) family protein
LIEVEMGDCLFCRIAAGQVPAAVVYESPGGIAFLDRFPAARGHTLVVPRIHAATLNELPDDAIAGLFQAVKVVTAKITDALHPTAFHIGWNHGEAAGQQVFHLHVHVIPRYNPGRGIQSLGSGGGRGDLSEIAAAIRKA